MITLFQFFRVWDLPNASPFCMKVENFLRMNELGYDNCFIRDPRKAPKAKLPYIEIKGELIADSTIILERLKAITGNFLDKNLSEEQKALSVLMDNVFCEHIAWLIVYMRWQDDAGWEFIKKSFFADLPFMPRLLLPGILRKKMIKALYLQGTGRHTREEIIQSGYKSMDAMTTFLGDKKYFLGDNMSSIDATAFAFFACILWFPLKSDPFRIWVMNNAQIVSYCERMWGLLYPEMHLPGN